MRKFIELRESLLPQNKIDLKSLQRFAGKCVSMGLAIPAARLYCREMNAAISFCQKNSRNVSISVDLRLEDSAKWRREYHEQVTRDLHLVIFGTQAMTDLFI